MQLLEDKMEKRLENMAQAMEQIKDRMKELGYKFPSEEIDLTQRIISILNEMPGRRAKEIGEQLGVDKLIINSLLYGSLSNQVRQDEFYCWWPNNVASPTELLFNALKMLHGATARELSGYLETNHLLGINKRQVNSILYSNRHQFWSNGAATPEWHAVTEIAAPHVIEAPRSSGQPDDSFPLYSWQAEALASWHDHNRQGVIEAVTASGKSRVGLAAIFEELQEGGSVQVLVPSIDLLNQWASLVRNYFPQTKLGLLGDGHRDRLSDVDILISVVNSARETNGGAKKGHCLLVADECHRYATEHNARALDERVFESRLGLSATYGRSDDGHLSVLDPFFNGTCYELDYARALQDEVTAHFKVALVGVNFNSLEQAEYDLVNARAGKLRGWLINEAGLPGETFGLFMAGVQSLAKGGGDAATMQARAYLHTFNRRRELLARTPAKRNLLKALAPSIRGAARSIVFTEQIEAAEDAATTLQSVGVPVAATHSGLPMEIRRNLLTKFQNNSLTALCAPKVLDEGIDVPEADLAIILAASHNPRQMIQRMGRVLRRKADGRYARFVIAYVIGTSEDPSFGAHEAFLENIMDVADDVHNFGSIETGDSLCRYLNDYAWVGTIPQPKIGTA
jgi:superfamily II DNA or RNA helicase